MDLFTISFLHALANTIVKNLYKSYSNILVFFFGFRGYFAPEYLTYGQVSTKLDVFSFGVLVLEIVSGRANMDAKAPPEQMRLTYWVSILLQYPL